MNLDPTLVLIVTLAFLAGGAVKGVVGMGLPAVAVAILGLGLGPHEAVPLLVVPAFVTNVWQALVGGHLRALVKRFWPMLAATMVFAVIGARIFVAADVKLLNAVLGGALILYGALGPTRLHLRVPPLLARPLQVPVGALSGLLTGMTGVVVIPVVFYLEALKLEKDELIQALGLVFAVATLALGASLTSQQAMSSTQYLLSAAAMIPALLGMVAGQALRARIAPERFRRFLFAALILVGVGMIAKAL